MSFYEGRLPHNATVRVGSSGGPGYRTTITETLAGLEYRNAEWSLPLHRYNAANHARDWDEMHDIIDHFHAMRGRWIGFRYKDLFDYKSCHENATIATDDQTLGTGDGVETDYQLVKVYTAGGYSTTRNIYKPVAGTVIVEVAGVAKTETTHYTVNTTTGIVTFTAGNIPTAGQVVKAGFEFDVPVRFGVDDLSDILHQGADLADINLPLVEIKNPA